MTTRTLFLLTLALLQLADLSARGQAPARADKATAHSYYYKGQLVQAEPSRSLLAVRARTPAAPLKQALADAGLTEDLQTAKRAGQAGGFTLVRSSQAGSGTAQAATPAQYATLQNAGIEVQPVFEQGMSILIPYEQVVVGFRADTTLEEARTFLAAQGTIGLSDVRPHRRNTFVASITLPDQGRSYAVSRTLAQLAEISFAEPAHVIIPLNQAPEAGAAEPAAPDAAAGEAKEAVHPAPSPAAAPQPNVAGGVTATNLFLLDFEQAAFSPPGWTNFFTAGYQPAWWGRTSQRAHAGSYSLYCAQSGSGAPGAPGPAPTNMATSLRSPYLDLSAYAEVYAEVWFYAKNDQWQSSTTTYSRADYPYLEVRSASGYYFANVMAVWTNGDCTADATTASGWRRLLYRLHPVLRTTATRFELRYVSNLSNRFEGVYVDDFRVVGLNGLDAEKPSNDPYSGRAWELRNKGQVGGLGSENTDIRVVDAWSLTAVSTSLLVAVVDDGVEAAHPDLRVVTATDYAGGTAASAPALHGTCVAGNIGAIANNGIGVAGMAPGVRLVSVYNGTTSLQKSLALDRAVALGARVINNSWGWVGLPSTDIEQAVRDALSAGSVVLFAAGNGPDRPPYTYEVAFPGVLCEGLDVITVGATGLQGEHKSASSSDGEFNWGSSYIGAGPTICAPGPWSYTTDRLGTLGYNSGVTGSLLPDGNYNPSFSGTSSATPKTAGIVALMLSANARLTPAQVKQILRDTADDIDAPGVDDRTGAGRVNAYRAVQRALAIASNRAPVVSARAPATDWPAVAAGGSVALSVVASDPEGDALTFRWTLDGTNVAGAAGAAWTLATQAGQLGPRQVALTVADTWGNITGAAWRVSVGSGDPNLAAHWSFANGSGTDYSGSGNTLSLTGRVQITWDGVENSALKALAP